MSRGVPSSGSRSSQDEPPSPRWSFKLSVERTGASAGLPAWLWWLVGVFLTVLGIIITWGLEKNWF